MPRTRQRVGVLLSGRGSNMAALLDATRDPDYPAEIVLVVSNRPKAPGLALAAEAGVATVALDHRRYGSGGREPADRVLHERAINAALRENGVEIVCLAGYMRLLTRVFVEAWRGQTLNIHPSLLPALPGLHTHERAIAMGLKLHGCTVHLVTEAMDQGPILAQAAVPVLPNDDADRLAARVLRLEHILYPRALRTFTGEPPSAASAYATLYNPT